MKHTSCERIPRPPHSLQFFPPPLSSAMAAVPLHNSSTKPIELTFKHVDGLDIAMDIYIPSGATKERPVPILLWWHGKT